MCSIEIWLMDMTQLQYRSNESSSLFQVGDGNQEGGTVGKDAQAVSVLGEDLLAAWA